MTMTSNDHLLAEVIKDFSLERKGEIIFELAVAYCEHKYGNSIHKKSGETYVSITLREPSFWSWYMRVVNITEKDMIDVCIRKDIVINMDKYKECIDKIRGNYNINKCVTYTKLNNNKSLVK